MKFLLKILSLFFLAFVLVNVYNMAMLSERLEAIEYALDSTANVEQKNSDHE